MNSTEIGSRLQTNKQTLTTSNTQLNLLAVTFLAIKKVKSDKFALTFRRWKSKTGKRLTITANFQERDLGTAGRIVKKLDRSRARD